MWLVVYSSPQDSESLATNKAVAESHARRSTLSLAASVVSRSAELFSLARERAEDVSVTEVLGSACLVTTLLPLVLAHISPLAASHPKVTIAYQNVCLLTAYWSTKWISRFALTIAGFIVCLWVRMKNAISTMHGVYNS